MIQIARLTIIIVLFSIHQITFAEKNTSVSGSPDSSRKEYFSDSIRYSAKRFPVNGMFGDTLFYLYVKTGSISPAMRAEIVSNRIKKLSEVFTADDSLQLVDAYNSTDVMFNDIIIVSIIDADAFYANADRWKLAERYRIVIEKDIVRYRNEVSLLKLAKEAGAAILVLICVGLLLYCIIKFFRWLAGRIVHSEHTLFKGVRIKNYTLLDSGR